jgi:hypothetical protein
MNWSKNDEPFGVIATIASDSSPKGSPKANKAKALKFFEKNALSDRKVRQSLNQKLQSSDFEHTMKPIRYKGGKVMYRSIEKPLKLYCHGMRIVDITNPDNQKEIRNQYVQNYNAEMAQHYQSLLSSDKVFDFPPRRKKPRRVVMPKHMNLKPLHMESQTASDFVNKSSLQKEDI